MSRDVIYSAGHSTRSGQDLVLLLREAGVTALADVRRFPASRRHPQFDRGALERELEKAGIGYRWLGESLGGRRKQLVETEASPNRAWQVAAFRHYADAIPTAEFQAGLAALEGIGRERPTAFLCAERLWWQCHRRILADVLVVRGWQVVHLLDHGKRDEHRLTEWARVEDGVLTYPSLL